MLKTQAHDIYGSFPFTYKVLLRWSDQNPPFFFPRDYKATSVILLKISNELSPQDLSEIN